jgi:uncharacterized membrane protein YeaQ/YmgE (transglycosylase-associated protein family)
MYDLALSMILAWAIFGLVIGLLAWLLVPGPNPMGLLSTMFLGVIGSFVGGLIAYALRLGTGDYAPAGWILSVIGAVLVLLVFGAGGARRTV